MFLSIIFLIIPHLPLIFSSPISPSTDTSVHTSAQGVSGSSAQKSTKPTKSNPPAIKITLNEKPRFECTIQPNHRARPVVNFSPNQYHGQYDFHIHAYDWAGYPRAAIDPLEVKLINSRVYRLVPGSWELYYPDEQSTEFSVLGALAFPSSWKWLTDKEVKEKADRNIRQFTHHLQNPIHEVIDPKNAMSAETKSSKCEMITVKGVSIMDTEHELSGDEESDYTGFDFDESGSELDDDESRVTDSESSDSEDSQHEEGRHGDSQLQEPRLGGESSSKDSKSSPIEVAKKRKHGHFDEDKSESDVITEPEELPNKKTKLEGDGKD